MTKKFDPKATPYTDSFVHKDTLKKPFNYIGVARFAEQKWHENEHNLKLEKELHEQTKEQLRIARYAILELHHVSEEKTCKKIAVRALEEIERVGQ